LWFSLPGLFDLVCLADPKQLPGRCYYVCLADLQCSQGLFKLVCLYVPLDLVCLADLPADLQSLPCRFDFVCLAVLSWFAWPIGWAISIVWSIVSISFAWLISSILQAVGP
jgi:hypothetical protein